MINYLNKLKKWWYWFALGGVIAASPLYFGAINPCTGQLNEVAPPLPNEATTYRVLWRERFRDEAHFLEVYNLNQHNKDYFSDCSVVVSPDAGYEIEVWKTFPANTLSDALSIIKDDVELRNQFGAKLDMRTPDGHFVQRFQRGSLADEVRKPR